VGSETRGRLGGVRAGAGAREALEAAGWEVLWVVSLGECQSLVAVEDAECLVLERIPMIGGQRADEGRMG